MPGGINDILNTTQEALDNLGVSDNLQTPSVTIATPSSPQTTNLGLYDRLLEQGSTYSALDGKDGKHQNFPMGGDQFIRGGLRAPVSAAEDVARLAKWFVNFKGGAKGPLFVAKQNLLSQTSVRTQTKTTPNQGIYTPLSTLTQAGVGFLGQHVKLWDVVPGVGSLGTKTYSDVVTKEQGRASESGENRLVKYYTKHIEKTTSSSLYDYPGGPGSHLGIGKTKINFSKDGRTGINSYDIKLLTGSYNSDYKYTDSLETDLIKEYSGSKSFYYYENYIISGAISQPSFPSKPNHTGSDGVGLNFIDKGRTGKNATFDDEKINEAVTTTLNNISNYQKLTPSQKETNKSKEISQRVYMGNPGSKPQYSYSSSVYFSDAVDKITALDLYSGTSVTGSATNDLVKFRIQTIPFSGSQPTFIHFRALIDSFADNYAAGWGDTQYVGRADSLHNYESFKRDISLSFTVVAQSKAELTPMYKKLNYLASILAPSYNNNGFMRGNMVKLTLGSYLHEQPGFITSLSYTIPDTSTWEIGIDGKGGSDSSVKELPHMIKVSGFNFTPIHTFLPEIVDNISDAPDQRYIALTIKNNKKDSLYASKYNLKESRPPNNE